MITIPGKIKVGYQNRQDTYTGKLAYVVYLDDKGVVKKERSWESWRDNKIEPELFDNTPTSGFVLNKKVGDYKGSWNGRQAWIRIFDPRNFEFEISVNNLVFILEHSSSIKGKGLEGEFIYAWDGKDLLLLPVDSPDYQSILEEQKLRSKPNLKLKDLKEGHSYKYKDCSIYTYLGFHDYYSPQYSHRYHVKYVAKKQHLFYDDEGEVSILEAKNFREKVSDDVSSDYLDALAKFKASKEGCEYVPILVKSILDFEDSHYYYSNKFVKVNKKYYFCNIQKDHRGFSIVASSFFNDKDSVINGDPIVLTHGSSWFNYYQYIDSNLSIKEYTAMTLDQIKQIEFLELDYIPKQ